MTRGNRLGCRVPGRLGFILESAIRRWRSHLSASSVFLILIYNMLEGRPSLGLVNIIPVVVTVAWLGGTMRVLSIPFNALTRRCWR